MMPDLFQGMVVKISTSDMLRSMGFYCGMLGCVVDERYTINANKKWDTNSYVQLNYEVKGQLIFVIGLFKDLDAPYPTVPQNGTVPSFLVPDVKAFYSQLQLEGVGIDSEIIPNTSDFGYTDHFFFFHDPDNNSLVARQNMPH